MMSRATAEQARERGWGAGEVEFHARMLIPEARDCAFQVAGQLTPYEMETLAMNARGFPLGSRLELTVAGGTGGLLLRDLRRHFARLDALGIAVTVRHAAQERLEQDRPTRAANGRPDMKKAANETSSNGAEPTNSRRPGRRVLVAEDDPDMRRLVAAHLRRAGHRVVEASDGMEILDRIEATVRSAGRELIDVIVSDIDMPGLSGLDLLAALRCTDWTTPVVLITAFGDEETRAEARELGAAAILDKPLDAAALRHAVAEAASAT
jgi:CheY-like chemotaxis protein